MKRLQRVARAFENQAGAVGPDIGPRTAKKRSAGPRFEELTIVATTGTDTALGLIGQIDRIGTHRVVLWEK